MKRFFILMIYSLVYLSAYAQNIQVKGTVTDDKGVSIPGVSVLVEGTKIGTTTNTDGQYSINIPNNNSVLVFSFIGFLPQKVNVNGRSDINIRLAEDSKSLDEVVVVGFGEQKKASVVGAISNIDMKELRTAAPSNLSNAIGGRVPGIVTRMGDGSPGGARTRYSNGDVDDAQVYIRGRASLNDQSALVLIDGVQGSLSRINPEDIEQFSILKDASATAVYGVRGANGVILITTRRGSIGKPKVSGTSQFRISKPLDFPDFLGSYEYASLHNEAERNAGQNPTYTDEALEAYRTGSDPYKYPNVNWKDVLMRPNGGQFLEQQYVANINGGTERIRYYISGEYNQSGSPFVGSKANGTEYNYRRYNLRSNMDFTITKTTDLAVKVNGRLNDLNWPAKGESSGQRIEGVAWSDITARSPNDVPVINPDGSYAYGASNLPNNPYADLIEGGFGRRLSNTIESNFNLNQKLDFITTGLSARAFYGLTYNSGVTKYMIRRPELYTYDSTTNTYRLDQTSQLAAYSISNYFNPFGRIQQSEAALNYNRTFGKSHAVTGMILGSHTLNESETALPIIFRGLSGRITYAYKDKYLIEGNAGYNGSDQFNEDHRYGFFPAGAIGWVVSEEKFFKDNVKFIDFLKFRASYGEVGSDKIGNKRYLYQYVFQNPTAPGTSNNVNGYYSLGTNATQQVSLVEGSLGNDQVSWEVARKSDIGVEARLFKSRVSLEADVFLDKRQNQLITLESVPDYTGLLAGNLPAFNLGRVTNKGYELSLSYSDNIGGLGFTVGGNYTFVRNNIDYQGEQTRKYPWQYRTGHPLFTPADQYIWTGGFYSAEDLTNPSVPKPTVPVVAGELKFQDLNGDGIINTDDRAVTGYSQIPEEMFGFNFNLNYKNFYISTFWQGASNVTILPSGVMRLEFGSNAAYNVQPYHMRDRWVYDPARGLDTRATAKYPILQIGGANQTRLGSTFHHLNGEYLRLKTAEFGYDFPKSITEKLRVANLRLFMSGLNILTFSHLKKYKIDPEYLGNQIPGQDATNGLGTGAYSPQNKFYAFGLNVTF